MLLKTDYSDFHMYLLKKMRVLHLNFKLNFGVFVISHFQLLVINIGYKNPEFLKFKYFIILDNKNVTKFSRLFEFFLLNEIQPGDLIAEIL